MDTDLIELAAAHGVATCYRDGERQVVEVDEDVVVRILGLLDVDAAEPESRTAALALAREKAALGALPGTIAHRTGTVAAAARAGRADRRRGHADGRHRAARRPGAGLLPAGAGRRAARPRRHRGRGARRRCPRRRGRGAGCCSSTRCTRPASWGIGDLGDLRDVRRAGPAAEHGAGRGAAQPAARDHARCRRCSRRPTRRRAGGSPPRWRCGSPTSTPTHAPTTPTRAEVDALRPETAGDRIEHDRVWAAKRVGAASCCGARRGRPEPRRRAGRPVAVRHVLRAGRAVRGPVEPVAGGAAAPGGPGRRRGARRAGPAGRVPRLAAGPGAAPARRRCAAAAQEVGVRVVHDLAVGCDPEGADGWALQDVLALGVHVGAPPDAFSQQGQDWGLPPWRPDRLAPPATPPTATCCARSLRHADGLRIDHVAGLWRLWWVPPGESPDRGTYVHYDAEVMLAVLTLEAHRAGALVIGEDLGTVEPEVTDGPGGAQHARLVGAVVHPRLRRTRATRCCRRSAGPEESVATVSTHDLPTAPGSCAASTCGSAPSSGLLDDVGRRGGAGRGRPRWSWSSCCASEGLVSGDRPGRGPAGRRHARAAGPQPVAAGAGLALRRDRRGAPAQPARHRRPVPELAAAAAGDRWRSCATTRGCGWSSTSCASPAREATVDLQLN